jgi:hypothetical protein
MVSFFSQNSVFVELVNYVGYHGHLILFLDLPLSVLECPSP